jgi:FixJ family two-component response regulator
MNALRLPTTSNVWLSIDDEEVAEMAASILQMLRCGIQRVVYSEYLRAKQEYAPPLCIITNGIQLNTQQLQDIRAETWPVPSLFLSDGQGHQFSLRSGVYIVLEAPYSTDAMQPSLADTVAYAMKKAEYFRHQQAARELMQSLSTPQQQVLRYVLDCQPNKLIAKHLGVSVRTIDYRKHEIFRKLHVRTLSELFELASIENGLLRRFEQYQLRATLSTANCNSRST